MSPGLFSQVKYCGRSLMNFPMYSLSPFEAIVCEARRSCGGCKSCVVSIMCGANHVWYESCVVQIMCGVNHVWCQSCVVSIMCGINHVWCKSCVVSIMCGVNHVWC